MLVVLTRPDEIMRLGVIQPVARAGWDPTALAFENAQAFASVGYFPFEPSPEVIARQAQDMAAAMLMGIGFPPYTNRHVLNAAKILATGGTARITSQGRTVDVPPLSQSLGRGR